MLKQTAFEIFEYAMKKHFWFHYICNNFQIQFSSVLPFIFCPQMCRFKADPPSSGASPISHLILLSAILWWYLNLKWKDFSPSARCVQGIPSIFFLSLPLASSLDLKSTVPAQLPTDSTRLFSEWRNQPSYSWCHTHMLPACLSAVTISAKQLQRSTWASSTLLASILTKLCGKTAQQKTCTQLLTSFCSKA